ncbi:MAG: Flp family type IVb pilin [Pseudomonadota bacterium]
MNSRLRIVAEFCSCQSGSTAIEYGLIVIIISVSIVAGAELIGANLSNSILSIAPYLT